MQEREADWTLFWRQLAELRARIGGEGKVDLELVTEVMQPAFYSTGGVAMHDLLLWLRKQWMPAVLSSGVDAASATASMKQASPKYVPREWMLVEAYKAAAQGDYAPLRALHELFKTPSGPIPLFNFHLIFCVLISVYYAGMTSIQNTPHVFTLSLPKSSATRRASPQNPDLLNRWRPSMLALL
jgi:hypothetical protein